MGEVLLEAASDDFEDANQLRTLLRDLREARLAKLRSGTEVLDAGGGLRLNGVGGMELAESRAFISGVIDGLRYAKFTYCTPKRMLTCHVGNSTLTESMIERTTSLRALHYLAVPIMTMICCNEEPNLMFLICFSPTQ
jgi:hypothetical protein